jgi:hypothetical protein
VRLDVRPHRVFLLHGTPTPADRLVTFVLPTDRTPKLLETAVLVALLKALDARRVLEIGTLWGLQTLNLAANLPPDGHVWTLDLGDEDLVLAQLDARDRAIAGLPRERGAPARAFDDPRWRDRVTRLTGDSTGFDFTPLHGSMHLVYVDGGHDARTVASDTRQAFALLDASRPGAVVWHDDGNPQHPDVAAWLDQVGRERDVFHVGETMLAFALNPAAGELARRLA